MSSSVNSSKANPAQKYIYPTLLLLALGLIWGSGYAIAKLAMRYGVPASGYAFWQSLGPAVFLSSVALLRKKAPLQLKRPRLLYYLICGALAIALPNTNMYFTAPHLPAGMLALIINITPALIYSLSLALRLERFHAGACAGVALAIMGLLLILLPAFELPFTLDLHWALQALLTPLCFALSVIFIARQNIADSPLTQAAGMLLSSALLLTPLIVTTQAFYPLTQIDIPTGLILLEIILSSLGYILFFILLKTAGPIFYSLVSSVVALTGLMWGWLIFGERLNLWSALAVVCIISGISLVSLTQARRSIS